MRLGGDPAQRFAHRWLLTTTNCLADLIALVSLCWAPSPTAAAAAAPPVLCVGFLRMPSPATNAQPSLGPTQMLHVACLPVPACCKLHHAPPHQQRGHPPWQPSPPVQSTLLLAWPLFARRILIPPSGHLWMAAQCIAYAAQIAMHRCGASPLWCERCAVAVRLNSFGMGAGTMVAKLWLDQTPPVTGPFALARHAMLLLFSSGAVTFVLLQAEVMRLR